MSWNPNLRNRGGYENPHGVCSRNKAELIDFAAHQPGDVFTGINTRKLGVVNAKKDEILEITCIAVDVDFKRAPFEKFERAVESICFQPTLVINSGKGRHVYWMIDPIQRTPESQAFCEATGKSLAARLGATVATT